MTDPAPLPDDPAGAARVPLFRSAAAVLRRAIADGTLYPGLVLLEGPLSDNLRISRTSVRRALGLLEDEGLICRFDGRGLLVAGADGPVRGDLRGVELDPDDDLAQTTTQRRIYDAVEADVLGCLVFGQYRLAETDLATHFDVSRTVVRDVLGRLQERGLVEKSSTSRWITAQLTARSIKEKFELRRVLEVAALESAGADLDPAAIDALYRRLIATETGAGEIDAAAWFDLADGFCDLVIRATPNVQLRDLIAWNYRTLSAFQAVLFHLGLDGDRHTIRELRMVVELLRVRAVGGAAEMHGNHLDRSRSRTIAQLKIVSVLPQPDHLAPYLVPIRTP